MSELEELREKRRTIEAIQGAVKAKKEKMLRTTREIVTADAVRGPENGRIDEMTAEIDACTRAIAGLMRECGRIEKRAEKRVMREKGSWRKKTFLWLYYIRCMDKKRAALMTGITIQTARGWIREEKSK